MDFIRALQTLDNPFLSAFLAIIDLLGRDLFYAALVLVVLWCADEKQGLRLGLLLLVSVWLNGVLKELLKQPRPFHLDPSLGQGFVSGYGMPSGHAQLSMVCWIFLARWISGFPALRRSLPGTAAVWAGAGLILPAVAFSRIYRGFHFPLDIAGGWILGGLLLGLFYLFHGPVEKRLAAGGTRVGLMGAALAALGMNALYPADLGGLFLGFTAGYVLMRDRFCFSARDGAGPLTLALRCLVGFAGAALIHRGLGALLPGEASIFAGLYSFGEASPYLTLGRFIRWGLLGLWSSAGAPRIFQRMGLAADSQAKAE
jgi:membrane-associated phospholipid phosphatase